MISNHLKPIGKVYCKAEYRIVQQKLKEKYDILLVDNFYEAGKGHITAKIAFTNDPKKYVTNFTVLPPIPPHLENDGLVEFFWSMAILYKSKCVVISEFDFRTNQIASEQLLFLIDK